MKRIILLIVGWTFIALGVLGLFLPILQGILFLLIGLSILSTRSETVKRFLHYLKERYPHLHEHIEAWKEKLKQFIGRD